MRHFYIISSFLAIGISSCVAPLELFEEPRVDSGEFHIGNFYSTTLYNDDLSDEVWFTKEGGCVQGEKVNDVAYSGTSSLHITWNRSDDCPWTGMGFGWDGWSGKNMGQIYDRSALSFKVRTDGKVLKTLPIALGFEDYGGMGAWVGFAGKMVEEGEIGSDWSTVTIPLLAFNWSEQEADVSNIKQLLIEFAASGDIYIDDVRIIEHQGSLNSRADIMMRADGLMMDWKAKWYQNMSSTLIIEGNPIYLTMDTSYFYIAAEVKDKDPLQNSNTGDEIWDGDALEVAFSTNSSSSPGRSFFMTTDKHFGIKATAEPEVWDWRSKSKVEGAEVTTEKNSQGYFLNARIPLASIGAKPLEVGGIFGLEVALDQGDTQGRNVQYRWNNPDVEGFNTNPSIWGEARIIPFNLRP